MRTTKPYTLYLIVAVTVILSSMLIGAAVAFEQSSVGMFFRATLFGALFASPWIFNEWRNKKQIAQNVGLIQGELLTKNTPIIKPYTPYLIVGLVLMIAPVIVGIALGIEEKKIVSVLIGIWIGSLLSCPLIWWYQQSKYPSTDCGDDELNMGWHGYMQTRAKLSFNSRFNDECTSSPVFRSLPHNIYHNRHY